MDFVIINVVFFLIAHINTDFIASRPRTVWLLANLAYVPAAYIMKSTHKNRSIQMEYVVANSIKSVVAYALLYLSCLYFLEFDDIHWQVFGEFFGTLLIIFPLWWTASHLFIKHYRRKGGNFSRVVIVGTNPTARKLHQELSSDNGWGYKFMGFFDDTPQEGIPADLYRGNLNDLEEYVREHQINEIFCTLPGENAPGLTRALSVADANVAQYYYVPPISRYINRNFDMYAIGSVPVMLVRHNPLMLMRNRLVKRGFDLIFSSVVLLMFPIILIPAAIAIKISSPGPIFFKQKRTGYKGKEFQCYKFRTMRVNAQADSMQATKHDPRKTRVGDFMRRTNIDELPQFINVFLGNMSLVGPRPHMLKHTEEYSNLIDKYMVRHLIKPGITGWAQVNGFRGQTDQLWQMERRVEHDVWYIEHWSFLLDLKIIVRTIINTVHGEKNAF
jgi:undecaprenyl-phosphate glucose phosphotransferase